MFSNYLDFLKFIVYLKNYDCLENPYFENITHISADNHGNSLIKSEELMLNFENICNDIFSNQKIKPSTVDGLYFNFEKLSLYFVEFKGGELNNESFRYYINDKIIPLVDIQNEWDDPSIIFDLNKNILKEIIKSYTNIVSTNLKLKPYESLFIIFPKILEKYAKDNNFTLSFEDYYFIFKHLKFHLIVVYQSGRNHINDEKTFAADIKDKYKVLKNNGIIADFKVYDEVEFERNLLKNMVDFPFSFLDIIVNVVVKVLDQSTNRQDFGNLIDINLKKEIDNNDVVINQNQMEKLRKACSKCCMDYINN